MRSSLPPPATVTFPPVPRSLRSSSSEPRLSTTATTTSPTSTSAYPTSVSSEPTKAANSTTSTATSLTPSTSILTQPDEVLVPAAFSCPTSALSVVLAGSWDAWRGRQRMYRNGAHFIALLYLPPGTYHYKFLVDNAWIINPNEPTVKDERGNTNNMVTITAASPAFDSDELPLSPVSSYQSSDLAKTLEDEPPALPLHLQTIERSNSVEKKMRLLSHVYLEHLYSRPIGDELWCMSQTTRVRGVLVDTVFVTKKGKIKDKDEMRDEREPV